MYSKVGLGSITLKAHTSPLSILFWAANSRAIRSLSTLGSRRKTIGSLCSSNGFRNCSFTRRLTCWTCAPKSGYPDLPAGVPITLLQTTGSGPKDQPIKSRDAAQNLFAILFDKLLQGVLLCR